MKNKTILDVFNSGQIKPHEVKRVIKTIGEEFLGGAEKVGIFGSTVRGERKEGSDIDIVSINEKANPYSEMRFILDKDKDIDIGVVKMKPVIEGNTRNDEVLRSIQNSAVYCSVEEFKNELLKLLD